MYVIKHATHWATVCVGPTLKSLSFNFSSRVKYIPFNERK
nr:MAG TPA: hypothetical protein [Caudoviricetes sp.]